MIHGCERCAIGGSSQPIARCAPQSGDSMSAATPTPGPPPPIPVVLTASDFATDTTALASRLGFSCQLPSAGVPVPTPQVQSTAQPRVARAPATGPCSQPPRPPSLSICCNGTPFITPMYDSQSIPLLSTGIGTAVSQPHPCCHSISLLLLLLVSHSQLSAAACCLLLLVCLSASIPPCTLLADA